MHSQAGAWERDKYNIDQIIASKKAKNNRNTEYNQLAMIKYLVESLDLTLREIEQSFIKINIVFKTMEKMQIETLFRVFVFFIILRIKDEEMYFDLIQKRKPRKDILDKILINTEKTDKKHLLSITIKAIVNTTSIDIKELASMIKKEKEKVAVADNNNILQSDQEVYLNLISKSYNEWSDVLINQLIDIAIRKVEFSDKFNIENDE